MSDPQGIGSIVIIGGGTAGWMSAAALAHGLSGLNCQIHLVESATIGTVGVGEASVPHIRHFNAALGIDEAQFMAETQATFKLGIAFCGWGRPGDTYIHPFGEFGQPVEGVSFHQAWLRARAVGYDRPHDHFSVPVLGARANGFLHPCDSADPLTSSYAYAYQFDAALYGQFLRRYAQARGVTRHEGVITHVLQDGQSGVVQSVRFDDGRVIAGDLFVDCSGFRGLLIEGALASGYEDWSHWLPCDRAIAMPCAHAGPITPYTRATAQEAGWTWRIPLRHRVGNGHVYCSHFLSDDQAETILTDALEGPALGPPNLLRFQTGKRRRQWHKNVVAIGLAAGFLEPLESTSIHLIQIGIGRLLDLFPDTHDDPILSAEYNRLMDLEYERVRDFLILHYRANQRFGSPFWDHCRTMALPVSLAEKMALFEERGTVVTHQEGMFLEPSWLAVYLGQNIIPRHNDPRAARLDPQDLITELDRQAGAFERTAARWPDHNVALKAQGGT